MMTFHKTSWPFCFSMRFLRQDTDWGETCPRKKGHHKRDNGRWWASVQTIHSEICVWNWRAIACEFLYMWDEIHLKFSPLCSQSCLNIRLPFSLSWQDHISFLAWTKPPCQGSSMEPIAYPTPLHFPSPPFQLEFTAVSSEECDFCKLTSCQHTVMWASVKSGRGGEHMPTTQAWGKAALQSFLCGGHGSSEQSSSCLLLLR